MEVISSQIRPGTEYIHFTQYIRFLDDGGCDQSVGLLTLRHISGVFRRFVFALLSTLCYVWYLLD